MRLRKCFFCCMKARRGVLLTQNKRKERHWATSSERTDDKTKKGDKGQEMQAQMRALALPSQRWWFQNRSMNVWILPKPSSLSISLSISHRLCKIFSFIDLSLLLPGPGVLTGALTVLFNSPCSFYGYKHSLVFILASGSGRIETLPSKTGFERRFTWIKHR